MRRRVLEQLGGMSRDNPCAVPDGRGVLAEPGNGHNAIAGLQNHHVAGYSESLRA
jgi:hypothetical protein